MLLAKVVQSTRQHGMRATIEKSYAFLRGTRPTDDFDLKYGTDTSGVESLWKLEISSPNGRLGERYQPTDEQEPVDSVNFLHESPGKLSFIDLGCGKGRTLLVAAGLGFARIIGVEFARELVNTARQNLAKKRIDNAIVEHADAADFPFPNSDFVVYLYNPFSEAVMQKVVARLNECRAKKFYIIYRVPKCAEVFDSSGFLRRFGCPPGRPYIQVWKAAAIGYECLAPVPD
jgi:SAM-dependent methyltransferase